MRHLRTALAATLAAGLMAAAIAAAADPVAVAGVPGLTAPTGLARDANGALWVADSGGGVCRLLDPPFAAAAGLVCPPKELQGPKSPGQMAFDSATGMFFVGDGAATGGAVWRLHLDQTVDPAVIDSATLLQDLPSERVLGMAFDASTGALHYGTKDSPAIQRIENAATCVAPVAPCVSTTVGSALAKGARSLAHDGGGRLYLAEGAGVTRIETLGAAGAQAQPILGFEGTYTALAFDPAPDGDGRIYAGTNNPSGADWIDVLRVTDDAIVSRYSTGFAAVTAIGIDTRELTDRALDVTDDRGAKQFGEDTVGSGRRLTVPFETEHVDRDRRDDINPLTAPVRQLDDPLAGVLQLQLQRDMFGNAQFKRAGQVFEVFQVRRVLFKVKQHSILDQRFWLADTSCKGVEARCFGAVVFVRLLFCPACRK